MAPVQPGPIDKALPGCSSLWTLAALSPALDGPML